MFNVYFKYFELFSINNRGLGIGDWGLAQSPIPNPQSPIYKTEDNLTVCLPFNI